MEVARSIGPDAVYTASEDRDLDAVWDDNLLKIEINHELFQDNVDRYVEIGTVVYEGNVLLVGRVDDEEARKRAENVVRGVDGVREVINRIQVTDEGGVTAFAHDLLIEKRIQAELFFSGEIASANLRVRSVNLTVYLFGEAADREEVAQTVAIVRRIDGVRKIENHLWVREEPAVQARLPQLPTCDPMRDLEHHQCAR